jgi:multicomponent Na+:H+ antiporter subunit F
MNSELLNIVSQISFGILLIALILTFIRLLKGPNISDRISSMDLIAVIVMGFIIIYSMQINNTLYFDIAIIISLVSFMGTVALSTYMKYKNNERNNN